ncbi:MAG: hypothetical protein J6V80_02120 [Clostridia bacterium]|nr:hypothetical protein [Clostridia bacterium]
MEGEDDIPHLPVADSIDDNYRTFYQIFVGSFSDSNGDGIGDIRGIINRMDYLNDGDVSSGNDLGIQGIWLSPIFSSPSYHKYDATDYYEIDARFGTYEDLKDLIKICDERNVKLILDLVINHTSNRNEWFLNFKEARKNGDTENKYYDYYSCVTTSEKVGGITYSKVSSTDFWYECNFSTEMPELNFENSVVREDMLALAKHYLDLGIDGFRFDAVKYIYFNDTAKNVDFWKWYMSELIEYKPDIYCVGECWSGEAEILQYYDAMNCFNFGISGAEGIVASTAKGAKISTFLNYIERYQDKVHAANPNGIPMPFLSNHDMDRIGGAFILPDNMRMAANLYLLSPGSPFIYYGEEIGIKGSRGSAHTDANRRLAMLWGDGDTVKNPEGSTYNEKYQITTTVKSQLEDESSLLIHYGKLINIRNKYAAIARGDYNAVTSDNNKFGGFYIEYQSDILGLFHNTSDSEITINISECSGLDGHSFTEICEALGGEAKLKGDTLTIAAYTSVILK